MKIKLSNLKTKKEIIVLTALILLTLILATLKINSLLFPLISICINLFLIIIYKEITDILKIKFCKNEKIIIIISIMLIYLFYIFSITGRKFIYYWDYSCYYNLQTITENSFKNSLISGIKSFLGSTWSGEYGNFLTFIPEFIFVFTNKTINSYLLSCVLVYIPYLIVSFAILIKTLKRYFKIENNTKTFAIALLSLILFPIFHATFIYAQPDIFGLSFIFLLISLLINYNFENIEVPRLAILLLVTFMLFITRRWYIYFILSMYTCYGIGLIITNIKNKDLKLIFKNCFKYLFIAFVFFGLTMFPFFYNVIKGNFGISYSYYLVNGFLGEISNQAKYIGIMLILIMLIGIIYGIIKKKSRLFTILSIFEYLLIIFLFTRIQNMGLHHSLLLVPIYIYFIYLFLIFLNNNRILSLLFIGIMSINFVFTLTPYNIKVFSNIKLKTPEQYDYNEIKEVSDWLIENLNENNKAYMITHNNKYNPDKFRNFYLPDKTISNYLPYGSAILGTHAFPIDLFEAKYIITTCPFEAVSIEESYNKVFNELIDIGKFKLIKSFDMNNGYNILVYERLKPVDKEEANMYLKEISPITENFKEIYEDIIKEYILTNNL